jgi:uncharacterized protein YdeI (BOF family)
MRRGALAGCYLLICVVVACSARGPQGSLELPAASDRQQGPGANQLASRPAGASIVIPSAVVSLRGTVTAWTAHDLTVATKDRGRVHVLIDAKTVARGHAHDGDKVQVVGVGSDRLRARYVAFWHAPVPPVSLTGTIGAAVPLGFNLIVSDRSSTVTVILASTTLVTQPLAVGEGVTVSGAGSLDRGVVASHVNLLPTPTLKPIDIQPGEVIGKDNVFTPNDGDTPSGGQSQTVDGIPCAPTMYLNMYHVHAYIGILINGLQVAVPDQIGLYKPGPISSGYTSSAQCYYYLHTHDATGMIHIESPSSVSPSATLYTLGNVLDVWGITVTAGNVGPFNGKVRAFVATVPLKTLTAQNYTEYTGNPNAIQLYSHEAIWLEVGPTFVVPPNLPPVTFYTEY